VHANADASEAVARRGEEDEEAEQLRLDRCHADLIIHGYRQLAYFT
jgi:hypothetical protein